jgi:heme-binding NEAT domain protein
VSVDKNGETDDVNYDFEDFEAAMRAKELVDAAGLPFVRYTSVAN